ncbi:hypothetical protein G7Y89_g12679 [Cudoniella acicularis]|uniref:Ankyrin n=1 Tax=Cudoniella acicularis TaxID=354080 RepID=A0A8H4R8Q3_9HELO|nr:hypothetical protein G7Y89_g12679 [Cudoniella acicularis]
MASPSASSTTLSIHSDSDDDILIVDWSIDGANGSKDEKENEHDKDDDVKIPHEYLVQPADENSLSPTMRAARDPDSRILKAVLRNGLELLKQLWLSSPINRDRGWEELHTVMLKCRSEFGANALRSQGRSVIGITTPLMEAIRAQLFDNVKILLEAGANPNGVPWHMIDKYAALFLRFRPSIKPLFYGGDDVARRTTLLKCMDLPQISSLTSQEVEDREWDAMAPFWCEEGFTEADFWVNGDTMPSLVQAAKGNSIDIFQALLDAGADCSFWTRPQFYVPEPASESSLSISSPLHAAISSSNPRMLQHILDLGFDPNTMPLANPTRCVTPLMSTIVHCREFNKNAFCTLSSRPNINFDIRTPVYDVHILHFAVARLDIEVLIHVASIIPLKNAGTTALGHTLLHIACMPTGAFQVQRHAGIIHRSIHETRDLRPFNDDNVPGPNYGPRGFMSCLRDFDAQMQVVKYLWENGIQDINQQDIHGNTPLHYLASWGIINQELLDWWIEDAPVSLAWQESYNNNQVTPQQMAGEGKQVLRESEEYRRSEGMLEQPHFNRGYSEARARRKKEAWEKLLVGVFESETVS